MVRLYSDNKNKTRIVLRREEPHPTTIMVQSETQARRKTVTSVEDMGEQKEYQQ